MPHESLAALFAGTNIDVLILPERSQDAVQDLLPAADLVLSDWSPEL